MFDGKQLGYPRPKRSEAAAHIGMASGGSAFTATQPGGGGFTGTVATSRLGWGDERSQPLVTELEKWLRKQRAKLSAGNQVAKAIGYSLNCWSGLTRFLDDGRLSNNAAERALRCVAVGRRNWTFAGSDDGGRRAAAVYTLIETAKLNDIDPRAWLADVLARPPDHPAKRIGELLHWNCKPHNAAANTRIGPSVFYQAIINKRVSAAIGSKLSAADRCGGDRRLWAAWARGTALDRRCLILRDRPLSRPLFPLAPSLAGAHYRYGSLSLRGVPASTVKPPS
jgi:Transposase IS66 family/IS66 C-terminal element